MAKVAFKNPLLSEPISNHNLLAAILRSGTPTEAEWTEHLESVRRQEEIKLDALLDEFQIRRDSFGFCYRALALVLARKFIDGFKVESQLDAKPGRKKDWTPKARLMLLACQERIRLKNPKWSIKEVNNALLKQIKEASPTLKLTAATLEKHLSIARGLTKSR